MEVKKNLIKLFILLFITNCGFTPIYKNNKNLDLNILVNKLSGDRSTYNLLSSSLNRYSYDKANKIVKVDIETTYKKNILAKDSTGKTTDYRIEIKAVFNIASKDFEKQITLIESFDYKSLAKNFEELEYEKTVKQNITNIISRKLINQLINTR
tara:strand:+ start:32 stop:493 length:462 start_codon:yes stop_codon:yes gene_type:complete